LLPRCTFADIAAAIREEGHKFECPTQLHGICGSIMRFQLEKEGEKLLTRYQKTYIGLPEKLLMIIGFEKYLDRMGYDLSDPPTKPYPQGRSR